MLTVLFSLRSRFKKKVALRWSIGWTDLIASRVQIWSRQKSNLRADGKGLNWIRRSCLI